MSNDPTDNGQWGKVFQRAALQKAGGTANNFFQANFMVLNNARLERYFPVTLSSNTTLEKTTEYISIKNKEIEVKISVICFFNLINITKVVYPISKTDEVRSNKKKYKDF